MPLTTENAETLRALPNVDSIAPYNDTDYDLMARYIFPHDGRPWTEDNFGPLVVPARGATVALNRETFPLYRRIIEVYENNRLEITETPDGQQTYRINGEPATSYTFQMDYYFMMGDNRHHSLDSRFWGFVPEDHVVGKAVLVWFSTDKTRSFPFNIRWSRLFSTIR